MNTKIFPPLLILYQMIDQLKPFTRNARTHSKRQIKQIAESIRVFGFTNPVLVDRNNRIIAGHGRVEAARLLGMTQVPTILLENLTEDQIRAYVIADNKLAENAGWDREILAIELQHLLTIDGQFDVTITGLEIPEIDLILQEGEKEDPDDTQEPVIAGAAITQPGDLWQLGKHKILCGSALEAASYSALMGERLARMVFCDPPYNIAILDNVSGKGVVKHGNFAMACGEMSEAEYTQFLTTSMCLLAQHSTNGSIHFVCADWRHQTEMLTAGKQAYDSLKNVCIWNKNLSGQGSFYRSQHEFVYVFKNGKGRHLNNIMLGKFGRYRTNVWEYSAPRGLSQQQGEEGNLLSLHPTVKPVGLVADALLDVSARGDLVLDPFLGSGSTLIAAERTGRVCYGMELTPRFVDVAIRRWQRYTGQAAIHARSRKQFHELEQEHEVNHG